MLNRNLSRMIVVVGAALGAALVGCSAAPDNSSASSEDLIYRGPPRFIPHYCAAPYASATDNADQAVCSIPTAVPNDTIATALQSLVNQGVCEPPGFFRLSCGFQISFAKCSTGLPIVASIVNQVTGAVQDVDAVDLFVAEHHLAVREHSGTEMCNACLAAGRYLTWSRTDICFGGGGGGVGGKGGGGAPQTQCTCMMPPGW
jgi:hypothetical protein